MDRSQMRYALLKVTLVVLGFTSWVFSSFIFATRPDEAVIASNPLTELVCLPASLPAQMPGSLPAVFAPQSRPAPLIRMDVVQLDCWDRTAQKTRSLASEWVRLTGRNCEGNNPVDTVSVRNLTNGYSATVFAAQGENGAMTTDFIPLLQGKNDILIRFEQTGGVASESQFVFQRQ